MLVSFQVSPWSLFSVKEFANVAWQIVFMAPSWKVYLYIHHMRDCACRTGGFHRKKGLLVTSGSPFSCHVITNFPPLCSPSMLLACPVENAWTLGTNAIVCHCFSLNMAHGDCWAGRPLSYIETTVDLVLLGWQFHWRYLIIVQIAFKDQHKGSRGRSTFGTLYFCEISSPMQLLSSHEDGGQRWLTDRERKSRLWPLIAMETSDLQSWVQVCN